MDKLKEKMLCALKSKADELCYNSLNTEVGRIYIEKERRYRTEKCKILWVFPSEGLVFDGYDYTISLSSSKFKITKEEYEEIMKIREEKIKEKQLKELEKLCNKEQN